MAQYPIPQFIEEEGKIVFFLTYRQFFELVGGGGVIVLLYAILPFYLFIIAALVVAGLTVIIAFLKVNNQSAPAFFLTVLGFSVSGKTYTWRKKESKHSAKAKKLAPIKAAQTTSQKPTFNMQPSKLRNIQKVIDTKK